MMFVILLLFVGMAVIPGTVGLFHRCPPNTSSFNDFYHRCNCAKSSLLKVEVICNSIALDEDLFRALSRLRDYVIDSLTIKKSGPLTLSSNVFRKLNIHKLSFEEVTFATLPLFRAFAGLEFTLEELRFVKCRASHWSWGPGNNFIYLETIVFQDTMLPETLTYDNILRHFPNKIRTLQINGCSVKRLGDKAFQKFPHLERVELNRNEISRIRRSMFPSPARRLKHISLTANPLTIIAPDTFVNMPRLEFLTLSSTKMSSLNNETFLPVWDQLEEIYFNNIRLQCNCDAKWMLGVPSFKLFRAPYCQQHGKNLDQLTQEEQRALCYR